MKLIRFGFVYFTFKMQINIISIYTLLLFVVQKVIYFTDIMNKVS